jgi:probable addiction module antidote protein
MSIDSVSLISENSSIAIKTTAAFNMWLLSLRDREGKGIIIMNKTKLHDWDASKFLKDKEDIKYYLKAVFEDGTSEEIAEALGNAAKAVGAMNKIAKSAKVNNNSLYRSLSKNGTPYFKTINKAINSLGYKLTIVPLEKNLIKVK